MSPAALPNITDASTHADLTANFGTSTGHLVHRTTLHVTNTAASAQVPIRKCPNTPNAIATHTPHSTA